MRTLKQGVALLAIAIAELTQMPGSAVAQTMDALVGDWDLNIAKSKFEPSPPMKKYTMRVIDAGTGHLLIKSDWIDSDGTVGHVQYSTAFDGKPIPIADYPVADTVTDTRINATTWKSVWTKNGKRSSANSKHSRWMERRFAKPIRAWMKMARDSRIDWCSSDHKFIGCRTFQ